MEMEPGLMDIICINLRDRFTPGAARTRQLTCTWQTTGTMQAWQEVIKLDYHVASRRGGSTSKL